MEGNPFTPSFGTLPVVLVGRDDVLRGIEPIFTRFDKRDIHWATHLRAHRGAGKTVLLDQIQDLATSSGWWVLQEDAGSGPPLPARIINRGLARLAEGDPPRRHRRIANVSVLGVGIGLESAPAPPASVTSVRDVLEAVARTETNGLLVTIDEVHQAPDRALNEIGNAAQHLHRDGLPLVFVMAGLPRRAHERTDLPRTCVATTPHPSLRCRDRTRPGRHRVDRGRHLRPACPAPSGRADLRTALPHATRRVSRMGCCCRNTDHGPGRARGQHAIARDLQPFGDGADDRQRVA